MARSFKLWLHLPTEYEYARRVAAGVSRYFAETDTWAGRLGPWVPDFDGKPDVLDESINRFDAILAFAMREKLVEAAQRLNKPLVNVSARQRYPNVVSIVPNNRQVGQIGAEHLLDTGLTAFSFFPASLSLWYAEERYAGFAETIEGAGHRLYPSCGSDDVEHWLAGLPKPIGIMCQSDKDALDVINACRNKGLRVPGDVAVLGVDNDSIASELTRPRLSSVTPNAEEVGYRAMVLIEEMLAGREVPQLTIVPGGQVVARESSDVFMVDDPDVREAIRFIRSHEHRDQLTVEMVANHVALTRRSLERRFRDVLGSSPWQEIRRVQLNRAKHLLAYTDLSIGEVAVRSGFRETKQLSEFFKEHAGMPPREYRLKFGRRVV